MRHLHVGKLARDDQAIMADHGVPGRLDTPLTVGGKRYIGRARVTSVK